MNDQPSKAKLIKTKQIKTILLVVSYSAISGIIAGLVIYFFKVLAQITVDKSIEIYQFMQSNPIYIPALILGLILIAYLISLIIKYEPNTGGGAIPRCAGFVRGLLTFNWLKTLIGTFISALLVFFAGLPFGVEGPGVIMGTAISNGVNDLGKAKPAYKRYFLTSGASAGFAIASGSIIAGTVFVLEEMHKRFSVLLLFVAMSGATFATLTVRFLDFFMQKDTHLFFPTGNLVNLPLELIYLAPLIGIGAGLIAVFFNTLIELAGHTSFIRFKNIPLFIKLTINLLIVALFGLIMIESLGNGHETVMLPMFNREFTLTFLVVLLVVKIITITVSASSGITGGLFVPVLVIGALYAGIFNEVSIMLGLNPMYTSTIIIIGMAAFFGTSMQAPITTIAFVVETTLYPETTIFMVLALITAMLVAELLHLKPLNEIVLKRLMKQNDKDRVYTLYLITGEVTADSFAANRAVREILCPVNCIIQELRQKKSSNVTNVMVHGGDRTISSGDLVTFYVQSHDIDQTLKDLKAIIGGREYSVKKIKEHSEKALKVYLD